MGMRWARYEDAATRGGGGFGTYLVQDYRKAELGRGTSLCIGRSRHCCADVQTMASGPRGWLAGLLAVIWVPVSQFRLCFPGVCESFVPSHYLHVPRLESVEPSTLSRANKQMPFQRISALSCRRIGCSSRLKLVFRHAAAFGGSEWEDVRCLDDGKGTR